MIEDPVVQEVRRIRQEHAEQFDYDLKAIFADLKQTEEARGRQQSPLLSPPEAHGGEVESSPASGRTATALARARRR